MSAKMTQGWASWCIAALAGLGVVAGLALAGGPMQARKERRDENRLSDLRELSRHINCLAAEQGAMPTDLAETSGCPGPVPRNDPDTGALYRVEPLEHGKYRLCAGFELPSAQNDPRRSVWARDDRDGDCVVFSLPRPDPVATGPAVTN